MRYSSNRLVLESREYPSQHPSIKFEIVEHMHYDINYHDYFNSYAIEWQYNRQGRKYKLTYQSYSDAISAFDGVISYVLTK